MARAGEALAGRQTTAGGGAEIIATVPGDVAEAVLVVGA